MLKSHKLMANLPQFGYAPFFSISSDMLIMLFIKLLKREVDKLSTKHTLAILPLAHNLSHTQAQLAARLAALIHHLHLFIPSLRGASLRSEEEALRTKLESLEGELTGRSDALGRAGGRMAELWGVVGRVKAQKEAGLLHGTGDRGGWAVVDPAAFEEIKSACSAVVLLFVQGLIAHIL